MRVRGDRAEVHEDLAAIGVVVSGQVSKPVYTGILLSASDSGVEAEATDLEIGARTKMSRVQVEETGDVVVPASRLLSVLREIECDEVLIESLEGRPGVRIAGGGAEFVILGYEAADFARLQTPEGGVHITFHRDPLLQALRRVAFAAAKDQTRYQLHGVSLRATGTAASFAASDGRRLAYARTKLKDGQGEDVDVIIPLKTVDAVGRMLTKAGEEIHFSVAESEVCFGHEAGTIISKLVEGTFPQYEGMIPRDWHATMKVTAGPFLTAVRQAALLASKDTMTVIVRFCENFLELRTETKDVGQSRIELPVEYAGEPQEFRFNPIFLLEFLRVLEPEVDVEVHLKDPRTAVLLQAEKDLRYVVMPVAPRRELEEAS